MSEKAAVESETRAGEALVAQVKERYGRIARGCRRLLRPASAASSCCGGDEAVSVQLGYRGRDLSTVPEGADLGLGCGAPVEHLKLQPGETVLDLGSGPGLDAFIAAKAVGPQGRVIGVDMTPAMLERARRNAEQGGFAQRRVPRGTARGAAGRGRVGRRGDEQLRDQPGAGQGRRLPRDRPRAEARRAARDLGHRARRRAAGTRSRRTSTPTSAASRAPPCAATTSAWSRPPASASSRS